ncbi:hypothetical protein BJ138DRAFT_1003140 [Hygrophoropsis aurantiaca]|uniref:Uncharacterized protein n=1 Tax=Hygrophoropsis aurantiaca TaxID=72124 RepID=A0ACB8AIH7_9AGAM|nr:hypothetical protein BJ138DRAFT_1003140 [Hygrophoropsis aurantiaca]
MRAPTLTLLACCVGLAVAKSETCPSCPATVEVKNVTYNVVPETPKPLPGQTLFCGYTEKDHPDWQTFCTYKPDGTIEVNGDGGCPKNVPVSADNCAKLKPRISM